jgi:nicotinate phosphoribosyltransferase
VYKLVAHTDDDGAWRGVRKLSLAKETIPGAKQVFRRFTRRGVMSGDTVAAAEEALPGEPLLTAAMRAGEIVAAAPLERLRERAEESLRALPTPLRSGQDDAEVAPYPVELSPELSALADGS